MLTLSSNFLKQVPKSFKTNQTTSSTNKVVVVATPSVKSNTANVVSNKFANNSRGPLKKRGGFKPRRPRRERTVQNYWWLKTRVQRQRFYHFWRVQRRQRKFQPFSAQRRRLKLYRSWAQKKLKYPYRYRSIHALAAMPNYINYKQLFHNQFLEKQTFRKLFRLSHHQLVRHFRKAVKRRKRLFDTTFIKYFELRLDTVVYRANLAFSYLQARQQVKKGFFSVNGKYQVRPNYTVNVGDCIMPHFSFIQSKDYQMTRMYTRPLQMDQYPSYMLLNERIPAALIFSNPVSSEIKHTLPISWQFITFAMLKYN